MAMGIILKDKKDIEWKGLPCASVSDMQSLKVTISAFVFLDLLQDWNILTFRKVWLE